MTFCHETLFVLGGERIQIFVIPKRIERGTSGCCDRSHYHEKVFLHAKIRRYDMIHSIGGTGWRQSLVFPKVETDVDSRVDCDN